MPRSFDLPRFGAAVRFMLALVVANLSAPLIFGAGPGTTFASFAVVSALYFLDYDGSAAERTSAYALSTLIGVLGIGIGLAVTGTLWTVCAAAFVIGFGFAAARAFRGFIARSFVGTQLAFVLTVVTHDSRLHGSEELLGWLFGSAIALIAALTVFPRHHGGQLRSALAQWCTAAAAVARSNASTLNDRRADLQSAWQTVDRVDRLHAIAGLWSKRTRALAEMVRAADQVTVFGADHAPDQLTPADRTLLDAVAGGFEHAAELTVTAHPGTVDSLQLAREQHEQALVSAAKTQSPEATVRMAHAALGVRVLSLAAESLIQLACVSNGVRSTANRGPNPAQAADAGERVRSVFRLDSVWLFSGLRTGVALAVALGIALSIGLEHGVWVVMAALAIINVSATTRGASASAAQALLAVTLGVLVSAAVIALHWPHPAMFAAMAIAALIAKWLLPGTLFWAQLSYAPFAVFNVAVLNWPTPRGLDVVRVEDIAVGVAVAVGATALAFPFGLRKLLVRTWTRASDDANTALASATTSFSAGRALPPSFVSHMRQGVDRMNDVADAVTLGHGVIDQHQLARTRTNWLLLAEFLLVAIEQFAAQRAGRPLPSDIAAALAAPDRVDHLARTSSTDPQGLVLATWTGAGLDILDRTP